MMYPWKFAWHQSLVVVLLCVVGVAGGLLAEESSAPQPLTGRTPQSLESTAVELSKPLSTATSTWLDPDKLTLPETPRVALLAPTAAKPAAKPKRSVPQSGPANPGKPPARHPDPDDLAGAFAVPGEVTRTPEPNAEITPIDQRDPRHAKPAEIDLPPVDDEADAQPGDSEGWNAAESADDADLREPRRVEPPARPLAPLTRNQVFLRTKLRRVLAHYYAKPLNSQQHDCWEVMHGMLAYELHSKIRDGGPRAEPITAIGHLCYNRLCKRKQMLQLTSDGNIDVRVGVGVQGHKGQFLALLAQCNVTPDYPMLIDGKQLTIRDLIKSEQKTCEARTELTFKLIGLMHYLPSDATWVDNRGETWDIPRLIREEMAQPIRGAACGGTHRLSGLTLAARKRVARGEPLDGDWLKADQFVEKYQNYAYRLQNRDGSLSTSWFQGPGSESDINRRVKTSGHILEWLLYAASDEQLRSAPTVRAVNYLTNLLYSNPNHKWEVGPHSHALHALVIYDKRVFQAYDNLPEEATAKAGTRTKRPTARRPSTSRAR